MTLPALEEVLDQIEQYHHGFLGNIQGASQAEIKILEDLQKAPLPQVFQDFLQHMGHDLGGLRIRNVDFSYAALLRFYQKARWFPDPARFTLIGLEEEGWGIDSNFYLETLPEQEPQVVCFSTDERKKTVEQILDPRENCGYHKVSPSLPFLLFEQAFTQFYYNRFPIQFYAHSGEKKEAARDVEPHLQKLMFYRHRFSTLNTLFYQHPKAACIIHQSFAGVFTLSISGKDENMLKSFLHFLQKRDILLFPIKRPLASP